MNHEITLNLEPKQLFNDRYIERKIRYGLSGVTELPYRYAECSCGGEVRSDYIEGETPTWTEWRHQC